MDQPGERHCPRLCACPGSRPDSAGTSSRKVTNSRKCSRPAGVGGFPFIGRRAFVQDNRPRSHRATRNWTHAGLPVTCSILGGAVSTLTTATRARVAVGYSATTSEINRRIIFRNGSSILCASSPGSFCPAAMSCVNRPQHATWSCAPNEWRRKTCRLIERLIYSVSLVERRFDAGEG